MRIGKKSGEVFGKARCFYAKSGGKSIVIQCFSSLHVASFGQAPNAALQLRRAISIQAAVKEVT